MVLRLAFISAGISVEDSGSVNEDGTEIIDVGIGRTWPEQVAQPGEKAGRIVVRKKEGGIEAERAGAGRALAVDNGPCGVIRPAGPAVGSVGVARNGRKATNSVEFADQRQRVFLVGPTATLTMNSHRELTARQDHSPPVL